MTKSAGNLGPSLFNIYICNLFLCITDSNIANYADDTTLYECEENLIEARTKIETESLKVFAWFRNNHLNANSTKSHVMLTTDYIVQVNVGGNITSNETIVKLLGITVDNKLSSETHLNRICKKS